MTRPTSSAARCRIVRSSSSVRPRLAAAPKIYTEAELPALPTIEPQQLESPNTLIPMPEGFTPPGFDPQTQQPIQSTPPAPPTAPAGEPQEEPAPGE